jgi:integrase
MATRRYGEGGVQFDEARQLWIGTVELPPTTPGKRNRRRVTGRKKSEMLANMRALQANRDAGRPITSARYTVGRWLELWAADLLPRKLAEESRRAYRRAVRLYLVPELGPIPLAKLQPVDVERMMRTMEERGLSDSTIAQARFALSRALNIALRQDPPLVPYNAVTRTDPPPETEPRIDDALEHHEIRAALDQVRGDRLAALAEVAISTGLRRGECVNLRWSDLDLDAVPPTLKVTTAKTKAGRRTLTLPARTVAALRQHRTAQLAERAAALIWDDPDVVFATTIGTAHTGRKLLDWWQDHTEAAGLGRLTFHATRHTAATLWREAGESLENISVMLGHANIGVTHKVYAKMRPVLHANAAAAMGAMLDRITA